MGERSHLYAFNWVCIGVWLCIIPLMVIKLSYRDTSSLLGQGIRAASPLLMTIQLSGFILIMGFSILVEFLNNNGGEGFPCWVSVVLLPCINSFWGSLNNGHMYGLK
jgi:hypothetical protein